MDTLSTNQKVLISALVGFVIGAGSVLVWNISRGGTESGGVALNEKAGGEEMMDHSTHTEGQVVAPIVAVAADGDAIEVADQTAGLLVHVARIELDQAGWVAVHEDMNGELGNILGAAWFPRGTSQGTVELLRGTTPGMTYHVVLYGDNSNKVFELNTDPRLVGSDGEALMSTFVTAPAVVDY